jgi:hypothetical protein
VTETNAAANLLTDAEAAADWLLGFAPPEMPEDDRAQFRSEYIAAFSGCSADERGGLAERFVSEGVDKPHVLPVLVGTVADAAVEFGRAFAALTPEEQARTGISVRPGTLKFMRQLGPRD